MGRWETIDAAGTAARMYVTGSESPGTPGVALLHAWWGLVDDVTDFADRLATEGFTVAAPDLVAGKTATTVEEAEQLVTNADEDLGDAVVLAAVDRLGDLLGPEAPLATIGYSFGAGWAVWCPAERDAVKGSIVYYGTMLGPSLARATTPVLGHFAEDDPFETADGVAAFEAALRDAGREVTIHVYPGTGHWFCEPSRDAYRAVASDLAFERTVEFLRATLAG